MIFVTGSITAKPDTFEELNAVRWRMCSARAPNPVACIIPCKLIVKTHCGSFS